MSSWAAVRLVAWREVMVKITSRSFLISTGALVAVVIAGGVVVHLVGASDPLKVGLTPSTAPLGAIVKTLAGDTDLTTREVDDDAAGRKLVEDGDLDALLTGTPGDLEVVVDQELEPSLSSVFTAIAQQQALTEQVEGLGGDPEEVAESLRDAVPQVTRLDPEETDAAQVAAGYLVGLLLFLGLVTSGQLVAQGVVEEKTSRVVELLLATLKPWQLMAGKVLGIGVVGLAQVGSVTIAAVGTATALGLVGTSDLNLGAAAVSAIGWFVLGFATYALALAGLAALVSRQEEVGSVVSPVMTLMAVPYVVGISIGSWEPDNPLVVWLSQLPFCAPLVMPIRIAAGEVPGWQLAVSIGLSVAVVPLLVWLAGRLYSHAVLQTGARVKLRTALGAKRT